ncbi:hypothetical protein FB561_6513 [Kribbella amoyensis]|uniref:Uncharacterized protein n=1 Tax=Kribbella amoyensis TaxID=996641 RepID=A0A561B7Y9_9ACTN|nr:hypothetical protein [Kribbella amoyensis]TWD75076.1 hypothetical protein FB561_6513 [Kribbella amoyensis]
MASMPACAIALAAHLPGVGAVILVDREYATGAMIVSYASVRPDPDRGWPKVYPWPKQPVPAEHPLSFLKAGADMQRQAFWAMPWGERADFYMDAIALDEKRSIAILSDIDLWGAEKFHPQTQRDYDQRPEREVTCCGQTRRVRSFPCQTCEEVHCPDCGKCRCDRQNAALVMCSGGCFLSYRPNLLDATGRCEECR